MNYASFALRVGTKIAILLGEGGLKNNISFMQGLLNKNPRQIAPAGLFVGYEGGKSCVAPYPQQEPLTRLSFERA